MRMLVGVKASVDKIPHVILVGSYFLDYFLDFRRNLLHSFLDLLRLLDNLPHTSASDLPFLSFRDS